jgi:hypothetical protein
MGIHFNGLDVNDRAHLAKLCGMFGSAHEAERASAAALADRFIRDKGSTWEQVIGAPSAAPSTTSQLIAEALASRHELSKLEIDFLKSAAGFCSLSEKQRAWLDKIVEKVRLLKEAA